MFNSVANMHGCSAILRVEEHLVSRCMLLDSCTFSYGFCSVWLFFQSSSETFCCKMSCSASLEMASGESSANVNVENLFSWLQVREDVPVASFPRPQVLTSLDSHVCDLKSCQNIAYTRLDFRGLTV